MPLRDKKKNAMSQKGALAPRPVRRRHKHLWIDMFDKDGNIIPTCEICKRRKKKRLRTR